MKTPLYILHAPSDADLSKRLADDARQTLPGAEIAAEAMGEDTIGLVHEAAAVIVVLSQSGLLSGAALHAVGYAQGLGKPAGILLQDAAIREALQVNLNDDLLQRADDPAGIVELLLGLATRAGIPCPVSEPEPVAQHVDKSESESEQSQPEAPPKEVPQTAAPKSSESAPEISPAENSTSESDAESGPPEPDPAQNTQNTQDATQPRWSRPPDTETQPSPADTTAETNAASANAALAAGQALAEHGLQTSPQEASRELHDNFGSFLSALGGNWDTLAKLEDAELWIATAENLLETPECSAENLQAWFDLGHCLTTLLHLASSDHQDDDGETDGPWNAAMTQLLSAGDAAALGVGTMAIIEGTLENLHGPEAGRDYSGVGQLQQTLQAQAVLADQS